MRQTRDPRDTWNGRRLARPRRIFPWSSALPVFDPTAYLSGLDWYLYADSISGIDNDPVSSWLDSSGAGKHYGQATATNQPTLKKNVINGHAAVLFATDDKLTPNPNPRTLGSANTLILVCTPSSSAGYLLGGNQSGGGPTFISGFSSKAFEYWNGNGAERATLATTASGFHILTVARTDDVGNYVLYYDGTQVVSNAVNGSSDWNGQNWQEIGANGPLASGDDYFNGYLAMVMHFNLNHAGAAGLTDLHTDLKLFFGIS